MNLWGGIAASVTGIGDAIYLDTRDTLNLSGSGHTVTLGGDNNSITLDGSATIAAQGQTETFVFTPTAGTNTISGYNASDTLEFSRATFANWQTLLSHATQSGPDTVIRADQTHSVTLTGVALSSLEQSQVRFL